MMNTAPVELCVRCTKPLGNSYLWSGGRKHHHECSPQTELATLQRELAERTKMLAAVRDEAMQADNQFCSMEARAEAAETEVATLRQSLAAAEAREAALREDALDEAVGAVEAERLTDNTGTAEDRAYDRALDDASIAILALKQGGA